MKTLDVISVGAALVDMIAMVERFPQADDEVYVPDLRIGSGGSAANFAVACSRLGLRTGFIGKIGEDFLGDQLIQDFKKEGVDIQGIIRTDEIHTGLCYIPVDPDGNRRMFAFSGAANILAPNDIKSSYIDSTRLLYVASLKNIPVLESAAEHAKGKNILVSLNPGALIAEQGFEKTKKLLSTTDIYISSMNEVERLLDITEPKEAIEKLLQLGITKVAITLGSEGCIVANNKEQHSVPNFKVDVVDTTGAGDAFTAGFISGLLRNLSLEECGRIGNASAALCITKVGARNGLPTLDQLNNFLEKNLQKGAANER
ncbi:MAG: carbohydrate kinase family protein [Candidatus Hodarchaeota archaeon]